MAMSMAKREQITKERTRAIQDSALKLFDEKGFVNTTISDIAKEAGMSNGLIYHYFENKESILNSYAGHIKECEDYVQSQPTATETLREFCRRVVLDYEETNYHAPIRINITCFATGDTTGEDLGFPFHEYGKTFIADIIKRGQEAGEFRDGDPVAMGDVLWHTIIGYVIHRVNFGRDKIPAPDIEALLDTVRKF